MYRLSKKIAVLVMAVALCPIVGWAQQRLSVDVTSVQVADGKKMTTESSIYLHPDGRMINVQQRPTYTITQTNSLGEMRLYNPKDNTVIVLNDREMASSRNIVAMFASGAYTDMALGQYGFTQSGTRNEEGMLIKTFEPKSMTANGAAKVEIVFRSHLPICMLYYNAKGECLRKVYFSRYEYGRIPLPMRVTEVEYTSKSDSLVRLSTYSNLLFGEEATSEMFEWQIPSDAKRTDIDATALHSLLQQQ